MAGSKAILRFPTSLGLSGSAFSDNKIVARQGDRLERNFSDVDNVGTYAAIRDHIFAPLYGAGNKPIGVLQLYNKKSGTIDKGELRFVALLQKLLGRVVQTSVELNEAFDLMLGAKMIGARIVQHTLANADNETQVS